MGSHGGTYGGNPMGCAAALATIDVLTAPGFLDAARDRGLQLRDGLDELQGRYPHLAEVRGRGLMVGCEITDDRGKPDALRTAAVLGHCLEGGKLILMNCGPYGATVRWIPPLVATATQIDTALRAFDAALQHAATVGAPDHSH